MTNREWAFEKIKNGEDVLTMEFVENTIFKEFGIAPSETRMRVHDVDIVINKWLDMEHVEGLDWSKVEVDTPIIVTVEAVGELKRYFAKFKNGRVWYYADGRDSWTSENYQIANKYESVRLATPEDR